MNKILSSNLTSYDLLKSFAVIIMVIDHIGFYFFPDDLIWRAVGRVGFPIWFFLIGHASGRSIPPKLWGGALALVGASALIGMPFFPVNALFTIILIRVSLDKVMAFSSLSALRLAQVTVFCLFLILPTNQISEYGTLGLIFAMFGYLVRHREKLSLSPKVAFNYMLASFFIFVVMQQVIFGMPQEMFFVMGAGTLLVCMALLGFEKDEYPALTAKLPAVFVAPLQFMGRWTLEIYIVHLLLFKALGGWFYPDRFLLFEWNWFTAV